MVLNESELDFAATQSLAENLTLEKMNLDAGDNSDLLTLLNAGDQSFDGTTKVELVILERRKKLTALEAANLCPESPWLQSSARKVHTNYQAHALNVP